MPNTRPAGLAHAEALADRGELTQAVRLLADASMEAEAAALVDARVLGLLGRHQHAEVARAVDALPAERRSLLAQIAHADTQVLSGHADAVHLNGLVEQAREQRDEGLASFGTAVLVEHLILHSDPVAVLIALQELAALPQDPLPPKLVLIARARLHRACSLARLFLGPTGFAEAETDQLAAVTDFNRAGWQVDRWLTIAGFHGVRAGATWAASTADRFAALEARDHLVASGSEQVPWARYAVAVTSFVHGDIGAVQTEVDLIISSASDRLSFLALLARHLDALTTLALLPSGQPTDAVVAQLTEIVDRIRREYPIFIGSMLVQTAHALIDAGRADDSLAWLGRVLAVNPMLAHEPHEREVMACRVALLRGQDDFATSNDGPTIADRLGTALGALVELGQVTIARSMALRSAVTARRVGADDLAGDLLAWVEDNTAGAGPMTWWDVRAERQALSLTPSVSGLTGELPIGARDLAPAEDDEQPVEPASPGSKARPASCELRLLTPSAQLLVDGQPRRLAPNLLRLIGVLGALDRPVATEQLIDQLWPDADPIAGRGRIKSAHHRLRQALAPAPDLVRRDGDVWSLDSTVWRTDLADFQRLAAGDRAERLQALRLPEGLLWQAQFPYDEALAERRSWLEARWLNLAQELAGSPGVGDDEIRKLAERLGLEDPAS